MGESYEMEPRDFRYLQKHISALTPNYQELLKLRYWSDLSFKEISAVLNVKESTAKVWHHRALKELEEELQKNEHED